MAEKWKLAYRKVYELESHELKMLGNSPEIFKYRITEPNEDGAFGMRLIFYEGAMAFISFHPQIPSTSEALFAERYNSGVPLIFKFKDGSECQLDKLQPDL